MSPDPAEEITDNAALGGRLRLLQPRKGHRFGHDAILLAAATPAKAGDHVVELGAGVGAAGLAVAARVPGIRLTLVEIDPMLTALAVRNIARNELAESATAVCLDVAAEGELFAAAGLPAGCAEHVLLNPPFYDPRQNTLSPDVRRRAAHAGGRDVLDTWVAAAHRLLRASGVLTLIYRADGRDDVLAALSAGFGRVVILPILPRQDEQAIRVIVCASKDGHGPTRLLSGMPLNNSSDKPTEDAEAVLRHAAALKMGD
jgi:tRNA1(Val) A37 N6-methylase TrmN6